MFRLSHRATLALTLAAATGLLAPTAARAGDRPGDRRSRDDHRQKDGRWDKKDGDKRGRDGRDEHDRHSHGFGGISIRIGTPPIARPRPQVVVVGRPEPVRHVHVHEEMPQDLCVTAYQTGDKVLVLITGKNRSSGYTTCLTDVDASCDIPTLRLRNTSPDCVVTQCETGFSLNAAICSRRQLCTIRLIVAGRTIDVPVTQVQTLS
jgi:hypothetical protein